jgi:hypothetical protein
MAMAMAIANDEGGDDDGVKANDCEGKGERWHDGDLLMLSKHR